MDFHSPFHVGKAVSLKIKGEKDAISVEIAHFALAISLVPLMVTRTFGIRQVRLLGDELISEARSITSPMWSAQRQACSPGTECLRWVCDQFWWGIGGTNEL